MEVITNYAVPIIVGIVVGSWLRTIALLLKNIDQQLGRIANAQLGQLNELQAQRKK